MGVPQSVIKQRLEEAGITPIEDQVEATTDLYKPYRRTAERGTAAVAAGR